MNQITVLIAENELDQQKLLVSSLKMQDGIEVVGVAENGMQTLRQIEAAHPQVVVFNMALPELDGFGLLECVNSMEKEQRPKMIALSAMGRDDFIARAEKLGVDEYLVKPVDLGALVERIWRVTQPKEAGDSAAAAAGNAAAPHSAGEKCATDLADEGLNRYIAALLLQIGIPAHLSGYSFLRQAVLVELRNPGSIHSITSAIYPVVAQAFDTTASRVERSIRNAVNSAWEKTCGEFYARILRHSSPNPPKPTNTELIAQLAERIRMKRI